MCSKVKEHSSIRVQNSEPWPRLGARDDFPREVRLELRVKVK